MEVAVYFHGSWLHAFESERTRDLAFFPQTMAGSPPVDVPTMQATGGRYAHVESAQVGDVQVLDLPYEGNDLSMLLVLPIDRAGLPALEESLNAEMVDAWAAALSNDPDLQVRLPRFRIETDSISLRAPLTQLGMGVAFTDGASFEGISEPGATPLKISDVVHRVFVEVNEEGTEAAAATAVMATEGAAMPAAEPSRFFADHPFLFFLRDVHSGMILFAGRVVDPSH